MRHILIAGALAVFACSLALAADIPPPGPAPYPPATYAPIVPAYNWSGFYIGVNGGGAFGTSNWTDAIDGSTGNFNVSGGLFGGTIGGNYQLGQFVVGVEADGDWSNVNGISNSISAGCAGFGCETKSDWLATVRGRVGYAWDRVLFYGTAGAAFADVQAAFGGFPFSSSTQVGWTAGAGIEYAIWPNLTAKVEYLFADFQNASCGFGSCAGGTLATPLATTVSFNENIVRAGINYKFGW
jgi:outer membrane immunogenic protein